MSDPLKPGQPPDDVLPYAPTWARNPGYRPPQPNIGYDAFSEEENPSYRSMAQMFAPNVERPEKTRKKSAGKMLLRFGAVVGVAGAALALFIGYVVTQPDNQAVSTASKERFEGVNNAVTAIQAALSPSRAPAATAPDVQAVETVPVKPAPAAAEAPAAPVVSSDRGAAPSAPPEADTNLAPEAPSAVVEPQQPPQVAALPSPDTPPAPPPAPIAPQLTAGELTTLMARGRRFVENGDFSSARPVYRRAAEAGYAEAALALGETYDPITLREHGALGLVPDVQKARQWYERARDLGSLEAPTRLERLPRN